MNLKDKVKYVIVLFLICITIIISNFCTATYAKYSFDYTIDAGEVEIIV